MRALSIRQPYAEQILRGIKTIEYRSRPTSIIGEEFYIYAAMKPGELEGFAMLDCKPGDLPTGVLVGKARISKVVEVRSQKSEVRGQRSGRNSSLTSDLRSLTSVFEWHLTGVERAKKLRKPIKHPQPVWFKPF